MRNQVPSNNIEKSTHHPVLDKIGAEIIKISARTELYCLKETKLGQTPSKNQRKVTTCVTNHAVASAYTAITAY